MNNNIYTLVVVICRDGLVTTEISLFDDVISAKVRFFIAKVVFFSYLCHENQP